MAYLYEEISTRVEGGLRPQGEAVRALLDLAALDLPQAKKLSEKDHWDLSLIDEIQKSGFSRPAWQVTMPPLIGGYGLESRVPGLALTKLSIRDAIAYNLSG